jgi:hypothetical protein
MRFACWLTKATNTYSEYVILTAFTLQDLLLEGVYVLRTLPLLLNVKPDGSYKVQQGIGTDALRKVSCESVMQVGE